MLVILLPNREIKQAVFQIVMSNSFGLQGKQDWDSRMYHNSTIFNICRRYDKVNGVPNAFIFDLGVAIRK